VAIRIESLVKLFAPRNRSRAEKFLCQICRRLLGNADDVVRAGDRYVVLQVAGMLASAWKRWQAAALPLRREALARWGKSERIIGPGF
jgi:hypothetical protein